MINRRLETAPPVLPVCSHTGMLAQQATEFCCLLLEMANMRVVRRQRLIPVSPLSAGLGSRSQRGEDFRQDVALFLRSGPMYLRRLSKPFSRPSRFLCRASQFLCRASQFLSGLAICLRPGARRFRGGSRGLGGFASGFSRPTQRFGVISHILRCDALLFRDLSLLFGVPANSFAIVPLGLFSRWSPAFIRVLRVHETSSQSSRLCTLVGHLARSPVFWLVFRASG
jgi:hypothetical protein